MTKMSTDNEHQAHPNVPDVENPYHTLKTVAAMFGVTTATIRNWIKTEKIEGTMILGRWHVAHSEVVRIANKEYGK